MAKAVEQPSPAGNVKSKGRARRNRRSRDLGLQLARAQAKIARLKQMGEKRQHDMEILVEDIAFLREARKSTERIASVVADISQISSAGLSQCMLDVSACDQATRPGPINAAKLKVEAELARLQQLNEEKQGDRERLVEENAFRHDVLNGMERVVSAFADIFTSNLAEPSSKQDQESESLQ